jgi:hypothetical protein
VLESARLLVLADVPAMSHGAKRGGGGGAPARAGDACRIRGVRDSMGMSSVVRGASCKP